MLASVYDKVCWSVCRSVRRLVGPHFTPIHVGIVEIKLLMHIRDRSGSVGKECNRGPNEVVGKVSCKACGE